MDLKPNFEIYFGGPTLGSAVKYVLLETWDSNANLLFEILCCGLGGPGFCQRSWFANCFVRSFKGLQGTQGIMKPMVKNQLL